VQLVQVDRRADPPDHGAVFISIRHHAGAVPAILTGCDAEPELGLENHL
jgi:hypothetical protein